MKKVITCDRLRQTDAGEKFWQRMMRDKKEITEKEFLKHVNIKDVLGESWEDYREEARMEGDPIRFYKSNGTYFFQRSGFEYIWRR